jgi:peptidoglycan hydrolase CwlO-like protein
MYLQEMLIFLGGLSISIIGYFLRSSMNELKEVKKVAYNNLTKLQVIENDYLNKIDSLNNRIELLYKAIDKLSDKIDHLDIKN